MIDSEFCSERLDAVHQVEILALGVRGQQSFLCKAAVCEQPYSSRLGQSLTEILQNPLECVVDCLELCCVVRSGPQCNACAVDEGALVLVDCCTGAGLSIWC